MNPIYRRIIGETLRRQLAKDERTPGRMKAGYISAKVELSYLLKSSVFIILGVLSASFGLRSFLLPNNFIDGGVTGISLITSAVTSIDVSILLVIINLPFLFLAWKTISRSFAIRSFIAIILLALAVHFISFPIVTTDKLLIAVFGGFFLGLGIGLAVRGGSVLDGTEVLAVFITKKTSLTIGDVILIFNVIIFSVGALVFSIEIALYAILTYLAASKTVDFVVDGIEEYIAVTIISDRSEDIRLAIIEKLGRGCTLFDGKKGFAKRGDPLRETNIVYTLVTKLEISRLQAEIDKIDSNAFIVMHSVKDAKGGMIKKKPLKH
jgi:uncharacterized membrane-anchored protein YitT (DUF2179 family)